MMIFFKMLGLSIGLSVCLIKAASSRQTGPPEGSQYLRNDNHIFNALHSAMRQWGSSLNHNGMSFFIAHVPKGTQLYHGNPSNKTVEGMEWLAFEPEHASWFAWSKPSPPHEGARRDCQSDDDTRQSTQAHWAANGQTQHPLSPSNDPEYPGATNGSLEGKDPILPPDLQPGWLHTYETKRNLRLLYIDGSSAGKSDLGTLDTQDLLLRKSTTRQDPNPETHPGDVGGDLARAKDLCDIAASEWSGGVDGFLRMETGFEIVMCDMRRSLALVRMSRVRAYDYDAPNPSARRTEPWIRAATARYDGIGGNRVALDFERMVSVFASDEIDVFANGTLPRLTTASKEALLHVREQVAALVASDEADPATTTDWQSVADMIVNRYARELKYLQTYRWASLADLQEEVERMYAPFIDYDARDAEEEIERCSRHLSPPYKGDGLAARAILSISRRICRTLRETLDERSVEGVVARLTRLVDHLQWPVWKRCGGCKASEICFVAMWPWGSVEDHERPGCRNVSRLVQLEDWYWGKPPGTGKGLRRGRRQCKVGEQFAIP